MADNIISTHKNRLSLIELIPLLAMMMALSALSIDTILPAVTIIGEDLGVVKENSAQLVISVMFAAFSFGQLLYGPLSDIIGRKRSFFVGIFIFTIGCIVSYHATNFKVRRFGRLLQG